MLFIPASYARIYSPIPYPGKRYLGSLLGDADVVPVQSQGPIQQPARIKIEEPHAVSPASRTELLDSVHCQ